MKDDLIRTLTSYRIQCDYAWKEVTDDFRTQAEYEVARDRIEQEAVDRIEALISTAREEGRREALDEVEGLWPMQDEDNASGEYERIDEIGRNALRAELREQIKTLRENK